MNAALRSVLEREWQAQVIDLARTLGYRVAHFRPAQTKHGWRTAVAADGEGYVDLTLVSSRRRRVIFLELKREQGEPSDRQAGWLRDLAAAGAEVYVARPRHLQALATVLGGNPNTESWHHARGQLLLELDRHTQPAA